MFKCTDCGQEFDIKPDYCDCGNDNFEEIIKQEPKEETVAPAPISQEQYYGATSAQTQAQGSARLQAPTSVNPGEVYSWIIFGICLIFSVLSIMFLGKVPEQQEKLVQKPVESNIDIPNIDKIWKTSRQTGLTPSVSEENIVESTPSVTIAKNITDKLITNMHTPFQKPKEKIAQQNVSQPKQQTTIKQQISSNTSSSVSNNRVPASTMHIANSNQQNSTTKKTPATSSSSVTQTPKTQQQGTLAQNVQNSQQVVNNNSVSQNITNQVSTPKVQQTVKKPVDDARTLANYKTSLRNKLASNINFLSVIGDGQCAISFKVDSYGNLVNRTFSKQSENDSLNSAVFNGVKRTPAFSAPPTSYKNETLVLTVKMQAGRYEVSLR